MLAQEVELWDLEAQELSHKVRLREVVTCTAVLNKGDEQAPYVLMGTRAGSVLVLHVSAHASEGKSLEVMPHEITPDDLRSEGEVVSLQPMPFGEFARVLVAHKHSGVRIWDLHQKRVITTACDTEDYEGTPEWGLIRQSGAVSSACWVGNQGDMLATGHDKGDIIVWKASCNPPPTTSRCAPHGIHPTLLYPCRATCRSRPLPRAPGPRGAPVPSCARSSASCG